ncbi:Oidioi.mRNA.OKI2018_I69.chr1.g3766.t1.cds [Oikopleura dioica]|uniref:Oidioi.mRNA.OKI2018_I69.chr1.g3766.t1.cds n=1 Tax=Oikopleura dioica TaxID=34765 RepID=A0ABN7SZF8_OIKDI|nr:Oidioi.mRNA.OKI2018_I69.chr1.g3766.t1.cds [Oikopleura dioica]
MGLKLFDEPDQFGKSPNAKGAGKKPQVPRFMKKTGECNIRQDSKEKFERFISDFFTTMIDLPFSIFMLSYVSFYVFSWIIFSSVYYVDAKARGDIDYYQAREKLDNLLKEELINFSINATSDSSRHLDENDVFYLRNLDQSYDRQYYWLVNDTYERPVCFENVNSFQTAFLFFVETETTVGYGKRTITANCPEAILLLIIQCLAGTMVDAFMVGCIFIKISKPQESFSKALESNATHK